VRRSSFRSAIALGLLALVTSPQGATRVTYRVQVVRAAAGERRTLAVGQVSGPQGTALRLGLRTVAGEVDALFTAEPGPDTGVVLTGQFFTQRAVGRSRRGLPIVEQDEYGRDVETGWDQVARVYPFGPPRRGVAESLWVEVVVTRELVGGETRPSESLSIADSAVAVTLEAVVRPRRAVVRISLVRGDSASGPRTVDLVVDAPARPVTLVVGANAGRTFDIALARPDPPRAARDRALSLEADVVCLRVVETGVASPTRVLCGRLTNVARRLPLDGGDTLVATFAWPGPR